MQPHPRLLGAAISARFGYDITAHAAGYIAMHVTRPGGPTKATYRRRGRPFPAGSRGRC